MRRRGAALSGPSERAGSSRIDLERGRTVFQKRANACINNVMALGGLIDHDQLEATVVYLQGARDVVSVGASRSTGRVAYMPCLAGHFACDVAQ